MVPAIWGSNPRLSDGGDFRFFRSKGRLFPACRWLVPASEFHMGIGEHSQAAAPEPFVRHWTRLDQPNESISAALDIAPDGI